MHLDNNISNNTGESSNIKVYSTERKVKTQTELADLIF